MYDDYLAVRLDDAVARSPFALELPCFRRPPFQSKHLRLENVTCTHMHKCALVDAHANT